MKIYTEPFWWSLFGAGGAIAALFLPVLVFVFGIAVPLGWLQAPSFDTLTGLLAPVISRLLLAGVISLSLFHWAHRFRFTLYDGLQLQRWNLPIAILCYGTAIVLTILTGYFLFNF